MVNKFYFKITNFLGFNKFTNEKLSKIRNVTFKNNVFDLSFNMIVKSVYLKSMNNYKKILIWSYFRDRGNKNVNDIIHKYKRSNLIVNYSILPKNKNIY
jgi:hypothetical protein